MKITNDNAESIGRPIFDKVLQSFANSDRNELIKHFPELTHWMTTEIFDETVGVLKRLGECTSIHFSSYADGNDHSELYWNVRYSQDEEDVLWKLNLSEIRENITVGGFSFNR